MYSSECVKEKEKKREKKKKKKKNIKRDGEINQRDFPHLENQGRLEKKSKCYSHVYKITRD